MQTDAFDSFIEEFMEEKFERSLIILGTAKIDTQLLSILTKFLIPPKSEKKDDLLTGDNPVSTLSSRIKLIYRLGIVDESLVGVLNQVREIRNLCAHDLNIKQVSFRDKVNDLKKRLLGRQSFILTKRRYFAEEFVSGLEELQCLFGSGLKCMMSHNV